jgi:hypothetical protein
VLKLLSLFPLLSATMAAIPAAAAAEPTAVPHQRISSRSSLCLNGILDVSLIRRAVDFDAADDDDNNNMRASTKDMPPIYRPQQAPGQPFLVPINRRRSYLSAR